MTEKETPVSESPLVAPPFLTLLESDPGAGLCAGDSCVLPSAEKSPALPEKHSDRGDRPH